MFQIFFKKTINNLIPIFVPILGCLFLFLSYLYNNFEINSLFSTILFGLFLFILPYSLGQKIWIYFIYLFRLVKFKSLPSWVMVSLNWLFGVIYLNIPFILNSFIKQDVRILTIFFIILLLVPFLIFSYTEQQIKKPILSYNLKWSVIICGALVVIYYLFIGSRMGYTSFN